MKTVVLVCAALASICLPAQAAGVWTAGGIFTYWSDPHNWDSGVVPIVGADVTFGTAGSTATVATSATVGRLTFTRAGDFTLSGTIAAQGGIYVAPSDGLAHSYTIGRLVGSSATFR